jgi:cytochrome c peroxidase
VAHRLGWVLLVMAGTAATTRAQDTTFQWNLPPRYPQPPVPADNPMSVAKVELGRRLFYDRRMSVNGRQSCASCHRQELAFTDGRGRAVGTTRATHPRGSMSLANIAYAPALTWANPTMTSLEDQALVPMFGTDPVELGLEGRGEAFLQAIARDTLYQRLFAHAFAGDSAPFTLVNTVRALAAFERMMISVGSPYDRYRFGGDQNAMSAEAKRGEALFAGKARCFQCHGGWNLSGPVRHAARPDQRQQFFNTGLYNLAAPISYPEPNTGIHQFTKRLEDVGKFRAPTLRNVAVTAPYMHDGSVATLGDVLDHYAAGGRTIATGPHAGVGRDNPNRAPNLQPFAMSEDEKRDLLAFLEALTDTAFLRNPALSDPWRPNGGTRR